ncbi:MAG: HAD family hydrolase [Candidatus Bathyarchaeia archaeon]|jgi:HAD superfamily hydrolase (TIGR01549 family)
MPIKAVIFDYIGTLVNCVGYSMADSEDNLHRALVAEGFDLDKERFLAAYNVAHRKYRKIRYEEFKEVTNSIWVAEALCSLGFKVTPQDPHIKAALNVFFQDFIDTMELREGAKKLLEQTAAEYKVGLISNFTHAPVIHRSLRKVGIHQYFNAVVVSDEVGCRKPCGDIFQEILRRLGVRAQEAVFIGDSPIEDIKGARDAGLGTVFVSSQFNSLDDLAQSKQAPDRVAASLSEISKYLSKYLATKH